MSQRNSGLNSLSSQRQGHSRESSETFEENEPVLPLGVQYVSANGTFLGNRKYEFMHMQK